MAIPTFTRKATGLVRAFSAFDTLLLNLYAVNAAIVIAFANMVMPVMYPGVHYGIGLIVALAVTIVSGVMYAQLSAAMPRSGGDYVYLSHTLSPAIGFMASGALVIGMFYWIGLVSSFVVQSIGTTAVSLGLSSGNSGLVSWGAQATQPMNLFILSIITIVLAMIFITLGTRFLKVLFKIMLVLAIIGTCTTLAVFSLTSHAAFVANFNAQMQPYTNLADTFTAIIAAAKEKGIAVVPTSVNVSLMALPFIQIQCLSLGFQFSVYMGGEVKTPSKSQPIGILGSLAVHTALIYLGYVAFENLVSKEFVISLASMGGFQGLPFGTLYYLTYTYTSMATNNVIAIALIGIGFLVWQVMCLITGYMTGTRILFSWSFNRVVPESIAKVSNKFHSPWVATLIMGIGGMIFVYITALTPFASYVLNYVIIFVIFFFIGGFAAIVFPWKKKDLFEASPSMVKKRVAGIPVMSILGVVNTIFFAYMIYSTMSNPFYYNITPFVYVFTASVYIIPLAIYLISKVIRKNQGIDIDMLWKEIPPE